MSTGLADNVRKHRRTAGLSQEGLAEAADLSLRRTEDEQRPRQHRVDAAPEQVRLLHWETDSGKPCYLSTHSGSSMLSRMADGMEMVQLSMGADVLKEASSVLDNPLSPYAEVRYAGVRLAECLREALRVAESRGLRLSVLDEER